MRLIDADTAAVYTPFSHASMLFFLNGVPTVDAIPVIHAKWITKPSLYGVSFCSNCDFELRINDTKYCPNCGAKMDLVR